MISISVDEGLATLGVYIAWRVLEGVEVKRSNGDVEKAVREAVERVKSTLTLEGLREHPIVKAYRSFYWRLGIDPTKTRPSSEALVRRALRTGSIPLINSVVDLGNVASMLTLVPIGIYDLDKVKPPITLRRARVGELFHPIGGGVERLDERSVVLADSEKVMHVFPHRDSTLTMVEDSTRRILVVGCGVKGVDVEIVRRAIDLACGLISKLSSKSPSAPRNSSTT
ncbi:MAG: hypothetical protein DRJ62_01720 [Thermoprotei archaeon]|nr:MAG: hypothetical protein DRJ62_01720 [Thermoprotei archaeon]